MLQAINRHRVKKFDTSRKPPHWAGESSRGTYEHLRLYVQPP